MNKRNVIKLQELMVEHLKSGLSLNTHFGCPLKCKYCILSNIDGHSGKPNMCATPQKLIDIVTSTNFLCDNNLTPLYINNRTDPFLPEVQESTYALLELLLENGFKSPILIITKLAPDERILSYIDSLNILFFYTYSGLPVGMDYNSNSTINRNNLEAVYKYIPKDKRFLYYRPVIPGLNDNADVFEAVIEKIGVNFNTVIIGGIRVLDNNKNYLNDLSKLNLASIDKNHKYLEENFFNSAKEICRKHDLNIVRHTSCAIACYLNERNRLGYYNKLNHCNEKCKNFVICSKKAYDKKKNFKNSKIIEVLERETLGQYEIEEDKIIINCTISQQIVSFIRSTYGVDVSAKEIEPCPSEKLFLTKKEVEL